MTLVFETYQLFSDNNYSWMFRQLWTAVLSGVIMYTHSTSSGTSSSSTYKIK